MQWRYQIFADVQDVELASKDNSGILKKIVFFYIFIFLSLFPGLLDATKFQKLYIFW